MKKFTKDKEIQEFINANKIAIVYFIGKDCGACSVIELKVEEMIKDYKGIEMCEIDGDKNLETCAKYEVFNLPLLILYVEGKESYRASRAINMLDFRDKIERYYNMLF